MLSRHSKVLVAGCPRTGYIEKEMCVNLDLCKTFLKQPIGVVLGVK